MPTPSAALCPPRATVCAGVWLAVLVSLPSLARAQQSDVVVRADRVAAALREREQGLFSATGVDLRGNASAASVADALDGVPGVHPRSTGDPLGTSVLSVRGSGASQVIVALDGVVLNDATSEGVDLSILPPALLERAEVYRGAAPVRLGTGGLGGAVELFTRPAGQRLVANVGVGVGSFLQRRAYGVLSGRAGPVELLSAISYRATNGDFTFYDDNGTPYTRSDDRTEQRVNNQASAGDALLRACLAVPLHPCVLLFAGARSRGVPGPGGQQLGAPSDAQRRLLARASIELARPGPHRAQLYFATQARDERYRDPSGLVSGAPTDALSYGHSFEGGFTGRFTGPNVGIEPVLRVRGELVRTQATLGAALGADRVDSLVGADGWVDVGPLRVGGGIALGNVIDTESGGERRVLSRALPLGRVSVRTRWSLPFWVRLQFAATARSPSLVELYGLGDLLLPSPDLRPERGQGVDAAAGFERRLREHTLSAEMLGYARAAQDQIVWIRRGPVGQRAFNLDSTAVAGLEACLRWQWRDLLRFSASYTLTDARIQGSPGDSGAGHRVPQVPLHDLSLHAELGPAWLRFASTLAVVSGMYYDVDNLTGSPARVRWDASVTLAPTSLRGLSVSLQLTNLLDQRTGPVRLGNTDVLQPIADYVGYPLPGRAFFVALSAPVEGAR